MVMEGTEYTIEALKSIHIKPGQQHQLMNKSGTDPCFLVISEPKAHGNQINCK